jgi:hypothetical protein
MPLSMIFPFHHGGQFYLWSKEKGQKDKQNNYLQNVTKKTRNLTTLEGYIIQTWGHIQM